MFALFYLLPLLSTLTATIAAPTKLHGQANIEPRQHRGGNRGRPSRVRPAATQPAVAPAPPVSVAPVPVAPTASAVISDTPDAVAPIASSPATTPETAPDAPVNAPAPSGSGNKAAAPASSATAGGISGSSSSGSSGGGAGSGPVGVGWDPDYNKADMSTYIDAGLQWWTNWKPSAPSYPGIEYVPMVHNKESVGELKAAMQTWPSGTKYVLSFNEPDQSVDVGGTKMGATEVVTLHNEAAAILGSDYQFSSPSVARGQGAWLDEWIAACDAAGGCRYDFVAYHYYGSNAAELIQYSKEFFAKYNKPLWLTEFACHDFPNHPCTAAQAEEFMKTTIEWFRGEGSSMVVRWAWFGAFQDMTNWHGTDNMDASRIAEADGTVNALGKEYLSL